MRFVPLFLLAALAVTRADEVKLQPIFNGTDLSGWKVPDGNAEKGWYKAAAGVLKLQSDPTLKGSILWTEKSYRNFVIAFDFKFGAGIVDSGIHIRNNDQIQIGISGSLKRDMTGSPYVGKYPVEAKGVAALLKQNDWNSMKIEARGLRYQVWLNGQQVLDYTSETGIPEGPIGIQLHGNKEMAIDYRDLKAAELP
ncbi:MAG: protein of unknown function DUF1080 [Verrucomicrobia bacterium]|jgi:hypothetical protein|nr:MAG: protein of unknown function DUF1080 [Verrucomicrobiota bacterium]